MPRKKLRRIREAGQMPIISRTPPDFGNPNPLVLELGCGKGEYTIELAREHPKINYLGIDLKASRLWCGARRVEMLKLKNARFLHGNAADLRRWFQPQSISEIWLTFPDPYPKDRHTKRRLTTPARLADYARVLKPHGPLHLKTDNLKFFEYSLKQLTTSGWRILFQTDEGPGDIQTTFERRHRAGGRKIYYLRAAMSKPIA